MNEIIDKNNHQIVSFFNALTRMTDEIQKLVAVHKPSLNGESYLTDREVSQRLKVSRRTLQDWRNEGKISYIMLGGKILYSESAIQQLLEKHYYKAFE